MTFNKKTSQIVSIILILSLVSCSKEQPGSGTDGVLSEKILITGADANVSTKTTLNGLVTSWIQTTDKVGIYSSQARTETDGAGSSIVNAQFTAASSGVSSAFNGTMYWGEANASHTFYAYYPYTSGSAAATAVPVSLPSAQTQSAANNTDHIGALDFMIATPVTVTSPSNTGSAGGVNFKYNHLFSVIEFQIKGSGVLEAVKLAGSITPVSFSGGTVNITQATPAADVAYAFVSLTGTSAQSVVTLSTPATLTATNTDTKVYMVVNPGNQTGNCLVGLKIGGTWTYISKAAPDGGFKRGRKYVVTVNSTDATATPPVDADGYAYNTVIIGTQEWMAENLKTTKYNDGTAIPFVNTDWSTQTVGSYYYYNNDISNRNTYGALYNWYAVDNNDATKVASNGGKNICPVGWHVPTVAEWITLIDYLGGLSLAGEKLKETGTIHWISNSAATNINGFTALPGGSRSWDGAFKGDIGRYGYWWSTSPADSDAANYLVIYSHLSEAQTGDAIKTFGYSVRCVKN